MIFQLTIALPEGSVLHVFELENGMKHARKSGELKKFFFLFFVLADSSS